MRIRRRHRRRWEWRRRWGHRWGKTPDGDDRSPLGAYREAPQIRRVGDTEGVGLIGGGNGWVEGGGLGGDPI